MRVAIVGAGWAGRMHADVYGRVEGVEVAAIAARGEERAKALAATVKAHATTDLGAILRDEAIDAVDVCVPSGVHRQIAVPALESGKHVFMETPMALSLEDADAILAAGRASGRIVAVAQLMKFVPEWARVQEAVRGGELGRLQVVHGARLSPPYWSARRPRDFRVYGEPMIELMIFEYEYLHALLGVPHTVRASGVRGPGGAIVHAAVALEYDDRLALVEGSAMMSRTWPFTTYLRAQGETGSMEAWGRFLGGDIPETTLFRYPSEGERGPIEAPGEDPYYLECLQFVRAVGGEADLSPISGESARQALQVALAARESVDHGEAVRLS